MATLDDRQDFRAQAASYPADALAGMTDSLAAYPYRALRTSEPRATLANYAAARAIENEKGDAHDRAMRSAMACRYSVPNVYSLDGRGFEVSPQCIKLARAWLTGHRLE